MNLLETQRSVVDHLVQGSTRIHCAINGDPQPRLAVYHNAYRMQLLACLRDTFDKTWSWLGDTSFEHAASLHIESHPPYSWTLADYGINFPATLDAVYPCDPEVAELAWLDWTLRRAFDGPDAVSLKHEELSAIDWETATLRLVPTLRVRAIRSNCAAIWTAIAQDSLPPPAGLLHPPAALRVWRQDLNSRFRSIDELECQALSMLLTGEPFADVCAHLLQGNESAEASAAIAQYLRTWMQDGLITGVWLTQQR